MKQLIERTITEVYSASATSIGQYAFYRYINLTSVDFPLVTSIGEDAFNDIENYISQQIKTAAQNAYNRGLEEGKKNKVVINPSYNKTITTKNKIIDLKDLDF